MNASHTRYGKPRFKLITLAGRSIRAWMSHDAASIAAVLFAMIYKFLPHQTIAWGDVWTGALVTAVLFTAGKALGPAPDNRRIFLAQTTARGGRRTGRGHHRKDSFNLKGTDMQKKMIVVVGMFSLAMIGGCNKAKAPETVASNVANAEQKAANEVADAQKDASKDVAEAAEKVDDKAKDLNNAEVKGAYDVEMSKAEGDRKIALKKCEALSGDSQKACKDVADADYQAAKAHLKAMRESEKQ